ncbi:ATPase family AAA domain-containing protein 5b isoform 2-T2 [Synchiropus picturatus]
MMCLMAESGTARHVKIPPIFRCRTRQLERNDAIKLDQLTNSPSRANAAADQESRGGCEQSGGPPDCGELSLQACLRDIQTSNPTFPVSTVFDNLLKKAGPEENLEKKRTQGGDSAQRLPKRFKCNDTSKENSHVPRLLNLDAVSPVKTRTSRLSRTRRLKQLRSLVDVQEDDSIRTTRTESSGCSFRTSQEPETKSSPEDVPWTEKYSPRCSSEVVGNDAAVSKLYSWFQKWKQRADRDETGERERKKKRSDTWDSGDFQGEAGAEELGEKPLHNLVLISGPSGVGKTASVYACAFELGFKVFEVNSSSQRSGRHVVAQLKEATQSHLVETSDRDHLKPSYFSSYKNCLLRSDDRPGKPASTQNMIRSAKRRPPPSFSRSSGRDISLAPKATLTGYFEAKAKADQLFFGQVVMNDHVGDTEAETDRKEKKVKATSLILFEEVDVVFEDDVGFYAAIKTFMSTAKRPVVLISDDPKFKERFCCHVEEILFKSPSAAHVCSYLQLVCLAERVRLELDDAMSLVTLTCGDIRRCLLQLQLWAKGLNSNDLPSLDAQILPQRVSCTASMVGLAPVTKDHLLEILERWSESDMKEILTLLSESWRRDVPLLYSNLDVLFPSKNCLKLLGREASAVKVKQRLSRRRPGPSSRSRTTSECLGLGSLRRSDKASVDCLSAFTDLFELMSELDAAVPAVPFSCRSEEFVWTGCEIKDGMLDELDGELVRKHHQRTTLEVKAAVEGLGFRGCWDRVWKEARRHWPEQADKQWRKRKSVSFCLQPQCSVSESQRRYKMSRTLLSGDRFGLLGSSSRSAACVDCVPYLRFMCRLRRSQTPDQQESCLNYLRSLGLPKSIIPTLAEDFFKNSSCEQHLYDR